MVIPIVTHNGILRPNYSYVIGFEVLQQFIVEVSFSLWFMQQMDVGRVSFISEALSASICRVDECFCIYGCLVQQRMEGGRNSGGVVLHQLMTVVIINTALGRSV
jgi:hypothetical protein